MCCVSVLVVYEGYTCYKENWDPFCKDGRGPLFPTVISMPGVAPCYNGEIRIKRKFIFLLEEKGSPILSHPLGVQWAGVSA